MKKTLILNYWKIFSILTIAFSGKSLAENTCQVPSFIKEDNKYYIETAKKELFVKVKKIDSNSCWIKVKEHFASNVDENMLPNKRKNVFWVNVENLVVVRKKSSSMESTSSRGEN